MGRRPQLRAGLLVERLGHSDAGTGLRQDRVREEGRVLGRGTTKPTLDRQMITAAFDAAVPF
ncbi:hypothetical protein [Micromonospora carbonacea]|uniref:hypothetical protein n=1 Tax=Micromonospora carbonacea TaxID=47853 RepID=UPI003D753F78